MVKKGQSLSHRKNHPAVARPGYRVHGMKPTFAYNRVVNSFKELNYYNVEQILDALQDDGL